MVERLLAVRTGLHLDKLVFGLEKSCFALQNGISKHYKCRFVWDKCSGNDGEIR